MEIFKLFDKNIKNEKDMKEYYLINKNWIRFYEEKSNYEKIKEKLDIIDEKDLKLEKILNTKIFGEISSEIKVKALPEKIRKEENFHLQKNQNNSLRLSRIVTAILSILALIVAFFSSSE